MKSKILPFSLLALIVVLSAILISSTLPSIFKSFDEKGKNNINDAVEYLAKIRNNQVTGKIDPRDVLMARRQIQNDNFRSTSSFDLSWHEMGPDNIGGRTRAILFDNRDAGDSTIYAGSVSGGLWRSTNVGITWYQVDGEAENLNISCIAQDRNSNAIYVGTGEGFCVQDFSGFGPLGYNGGFIGKGIYKSTDGENFVQLPATKPTIENDDTIAWAFVSRITIDQNNNKVYAATNKGLRYSTDGGTTWNIAQYVDSTGNHELLGNSTDVKIATDGTIVASVDNLCYISANGNDNNFICHSTADTFNLPPTGLNRVEFAIAPTDPNIIYASVVDYLGDLENIYRSTDKGVHWLVILPGGNTTIEIFDGQGCYDNTIEVFPDNPDKILVGGIDMWEGEKINETGYFQWEQRSTGNTSPYQLIYVHSNHHTYVFRPDHPNEVFVGSDGGINVGLIGEDYYEFTPLNKTYNVTQFYTIACSGKKIEAMGGTQENGTIFISGVGNTPKKGQGIWATGTGNSISGIGGSCAISLINPEVFIYSNGADNFRRSEDRALNFSGTTFLESNQIQGSLFITPAVLWESFTDQNSRDSIVFHAKKAYASGETIQVRSNTFDHPFYYTTPNAIAQGDSVLIKDIIQSKYFLTTYNSVWMTKEILDFTSDPPEWFQISSKSITGFTGNPQCLSYSSDANHLFVGTQEGKLYRMSNIALAYNYERADVRSPYCIISTSKLPIYIPGTTDEISQAITSIAVNPNDPENVVITLGNYGNSHYVYMTTNALDSLPEFRSIQGDPENGGLPLMPVYASVIERDEDELVIIGTEYGIYLSNTIHDVNPVWEVENTGMNIEPVFMLKQQTVNQPADSVVTWDGLDSIWIVYPGVSNLGIIYSATHGRGIFRCNNFYHPVGIDDDLIANNSSYLNLKLYPNPVIDKAKISFKLENSANIILKIFDLNGRLVNSIDMRQMTSGDHEISLDCSYLNRGAYLIQLIAGKESSTSKFVIIK